MGILEDCRVCVKTDIGLKRESNQDSYLIVDRSKEKYDIQTFGALFAVADGMGGHAEGGMASTMASQGLLDFYHGAPKLDNNQLSSEAMLAQLEEVIRNTHKRIRNFSKENRGYHGMGTTLSVMVIMEVAVLIAHAGDSRIYRLRNDALEQLTEDHTMAQLSVEMGYLTKEEALNHPTQHILTEALGQGLDEIQTKIETVIPGDIFLLCSDGLHHMVSDEEIKKHLQTSSSQNSICDLLVEASLNRGGKDNVTVIVITV